MAFLNAKEEKLKKLKKFLIGKTIKDFTSKSFLHTLHFTDGTKLQFRPHTDVTTKSNGVTWKGQIVANPIQKNGEISWKE